MLPRRSYHALKRLPMVSLVNAGSIRKSIPAGPITAQNVVEIVPFPNYVEVLRVPAATLVAALTNGLSRFGDDPADPRCVAARRKREGAWARGWVRGLLWRAAAPRAPPCSGAEHACPSCFTHARHPRPHPPLRSGRFPQISGMRFVFDPVAKAVVSAHLADGRRLFGPAGPYMYGRYRHSRTYTGDVLLATTNCR